jgi:hypothetical protein
VTWRRNRARVPQDCFWVWQYHPIIAPDLLRQSRAANRLLKKSRFSLLGANCGAAANTCRISKRRRRCLTSFADRPTAQLAAVGPSFPDRTGRRRRSPGDRGSGRPGLGHHRPRDAVLRPRAVRHGSRRGRLQSASAGGAVLRRHLVAGAIDIRRQSRILTIHRGEV